MSRSAQIRRGGDASDRIVVDQEAIEPVVNDATRCCAQARDAAQALGASLKPSLDELIARRQDELRGRPPP
jgi:hypothetical protein